MRLFLLAAAIAATLFTGCSTTRPRQGGATPGVRSALLPPGVHGRLTGRTMRPEYLTIHSTSNRGGTADNHARLLSRSGIRSKNGPRFGRSGWVNWHYTVDDREAVQHMLPTEEADHADYGGGGDKKSIGIEICEFSQKGRQAGAIDRAARLAAALADRHGIATSNIVPHQHWPRWDYRTGKPCPRIFLERGRVEGGGKWKAFLAKVDRYR